MKSLIGGAKNVLLFSCINKSSYHSFDSFNNEIMKFFRSRNIKNILLIPYAVKKHDECLCSAEKMFNKMRINVESIHKHKNPMEAVEKCEGIFVSGGNTFLLLKTLYDKGLVDVIRKRVTVDGVPYLGISAGANVATSSIHTTSDMPIAYPPTFKALQLVPFNINIPYEETNQFIKYTGETRDDRIKEYLKMPDAKPVLGLRGQSMLKIIGDKMILKGQKAAKLFLPSKKTGDCKANSDLSFLLNNYN